MDWTWVNDKLPGETSWVLVYGDGAMACRAYNTERQRWEDWDGCDHAGLSLASITHWMPLPARPPTIPAIVDGVATRNIEAGEEIELPLVEYAKIVHRDIAMEGLNNA